ncbi:MAG TPA: nitroreductase family protein [Actinomycetota bacterium]|nr:nitroreductase family protein [Actinomycetota bacterium]
METWDAIRARRNVREFADRPIAKDDLDLILEAGRRSPSSRNTQPWDFVAITDRDQLRDLAKVWRGGWHVAGSAATIAVIAPRTDDARMEAVIEYDLGQASMAMMIAAADRGIGSCHSAVRDEDLAREILGYPNDRRCAVLISLGYPADRPLRPIRSPNRRAFDDVAHYGRW